MNGESRLVLIHYTHDAIDILNHSVMLYEEGHQSFYRVAAAQLRILLCDTTFRHNRQEDIAVVPLLMPELRFLPFTKNALPDSQKPDLDLQQWLDSQAGIEMGLTIRQLIRRVCDQDGGAHVDIKPLAGIPVQENARQWIINIARYVSPLIAEKLPN